MPAGGVGGGTTTGNAAMIVGAALLGTTGNLQAYGGGVVCPLGAPDAGEG